MTADDVGEWMARSGKRVVVDSVDEETGEAWGWFDDRDEETGMLRGYLDMEWTAGGVDKDGVRAFDLVAPTGWKLEQEVVESDEGEEWKRA